MGNNLGPDRSVLRGAPVQEQTKAVLGQIEALLTRAGGSKAKLLSATIWLADMAESKFVSLPSPRA
jgi:enamine deaminase RidA (YjgF/YER057c/UK114 family)